MKYIPSEESEGINSVTEKNPLLNVLVLLVGCAVLYVLFIVFLGLLGETAAVQVPAKYEKSLFSFLDLKMGQKPWGIGNDIVSDIFKNNSIGEDFKPEIFLSCENTVNAIALPGKKIIVFKGLLKDITSLNSLYFVIGHEIGHIINRDHLKSIGRAIAISLGLSLVTFGTDASSFFSINQSIIDRQFSQNQESHSDKRAIEYTIKRFNGLYRSHEFFDQISLKEPDSKIAGFLNTHPMTQDRIEKIKTHTSYNPTTTIVEKFDPQKLDCP